MERTLTATSSRVARPFGLAVVGGFTTAKRNARGDGVTAWRIDPGSGEWTLTDCLSGLVNPSFLVADPLRPVFYTVHGDCDYASAIGIDPARATLRLLGQAATGGTNGVHPALAPTGNHLIVANYGSGSVAVLPVRPDGRLDDFIRSVDLPGPVGPHRDEQAMSHPHHVVFDPSGRFVLVPDKGLDRVFVLRFDPRDGGLSLHAGGEAIMRPGAGPRHIVFHPVLQLAFVLNELESTVATCRWDMEAGRLAPVDLATTLPRDFFGNSTAAAIVVSPCGRHVLASNRGHDSIVHFEFNEETNRLGTIGWTPSRGRDPRFMTLDPSGRILFVANEQGDSIVSFERRPQMPALVPRGGPVPVCSPTTIAFV